MTSFSKDGRQQAKAVAPTPACPIGQAHRRATFSWLLLLAGSLLWSCSGPSSAITQEAEEGAGAGTSAEMASGGQGVEVSSDDGSDPSASTGSGGSGGVGQGSAAGGSTALPSSGGATASSGGAQNAASGGSVASGGAGELSPLTVYIAGDSTVATYTDTTSESDMAGWGQMLGGIFSEQVEVVNRAQGGRTARWFYMEGGVDWVLERLQPGDYFLVQFGTNDSHKTATFTVDGQTYDRYADPNTDFKTHLLDFYIDPTRAKSGNVILVTPPPRNSAYCGTGNSLGAHAQAMRELGEAELVPVLDLNMKTFDHLTGICPAPSPEDFFAFRADGSVDGTHFQEGGARQMARFLGEEMEEITLPLAAYLK